MKAERLLLGVRASATKEQVKKRWREIVLSLHPDHGGDAAEFDKYRAAYEKVLAKAPVCGVCRDRGTLDIRSGFRSATILCECKKAPRK